MEPSAGDSPKPHPTTRQVVTALVMVVAGFGLAAAIIHLGIRDPLHLYAEIRSEKLAMLDQWSGRANTAAFGSSHVDNGFDPRVFDREMGTKAGSISLNLGVSGGSQTEQAAVLDAFLKSLSLPEPDAPPRLALLEISASANFTNDHLFHPRAINIYDLRTVDLSLAFADHAHIGWWRAFGRAGFGLVAGLLHYCNLGMLSSQIFSPPMNASLFQAQTVDDRRGLTPNSTAPPDSKDFHAVQALLAAHHVARPVPGEIIGGHLELVRELAEEARRKHVRFVYFVAPRLDNLDSYTTYPAAIAGPLGPILLLNEGNPVLHPDLYRPEYWHDPMHLTAAGAALFTKILADDLRSKLLNTNFDVTAGRDRALR